MQRLWTVLKSYPVFLHIFSFAFFVSSNLCLAQKNNMYLVTRLPASYVPDDDMIVRPVENELSFYQQYVANDQSQEVVQSRNQLKVWSENQLFAEQYGHDSTLAGSTFVPNSDAKWEYFKDKYMRYLKRKGEEPLKDMPKDWYQQLRASNEIDTIDEMEARFKKSHSKSSSENLPKALQQKEVSLWKETKFIFQPRVDQGLVVVGIKGPVAHARAWVGVNGKTEINIKKDIDSIGFRAMYNYESDTGRYITSVDQRVSENLFARVTKLNDPALKLNDETVMLLYAKQF